MKIIATKNYEESSSVVANILADIVRAEDTACLGLATGSSMEGVYAALVRLFTSKEVRFKNVKTANLDEYVGLPPSHPQSYRTYMDRNFFSHVDIAHTNTCIPLGTEPPEAMLRQFQDFLDVHPRALQLLGVGANGHVGFNEPGKFFEANAHIVNLDAQTRKDNARFFVNGETVPRQAVTMGAGDILKARRIALLVHGGGKQEAVRHLLGHDRVTPEWPCTLLKLHPDVTVVLTQELLDGAR